MLWCRIYPTPILEMMSLILSNQRRRPRLLGIWTRKKVVATSGNPRSMKQFSDMRYRLHRTKPWTVFVNAPRIARCDPHTRFSSLSPVPAWGMYNWTAFTNLPWVWSARTSTERVTTRLPIRPGRPCSSLTLTLEGSGASVSAAGNILNATSACPSNGRFPAFHEGTLWTRYISGPYVCARNASSPNHGGHCQQRPGWRRYGGSGEHT